ncbi:MAG: hypothetical protein KGO96_11070 [Elusimicrobia bacterium]|nr:hypothetical protein [Elusimicrobiota bacterium]MDE2237764.1 hypothetical protein [Elusimicrobiota bacterium]MDE2426433.1 hypothetical protein [Elusimicrobiota bacterium]
MIGRLVLAAVLSAGSAAGAAEISAGGFASHYLVLRVSFDDALGRIAGIPKEQQTYENTVVALERARADFVEQAGHLSALACASGRRETWRVGSLIAQDVHRRAGASPAGGDPDSIIAQVRRHFPQEIPTKQFAAHYLALKNYFDGAAAKIVSLPGDGRSFERTLGAFNGARAAFVERTGHLSALASASGRQETRSAGSLIARASRLRAAILPVRDPLRNIIEQAPFRGPAQRQDLLSFLNEVELREADDIREGEAKLEELEAELFLLAWAGPPDADALTPGR